MIRIYTKPKGQMPNYNDPMVLPMDKRSVEWFCKRIHKGLLDVFDYAIIWGTSAKYHGQHVGLSHILNDEDVIQIVKTR